jgi:hypothetical protein
MSTILPPGTKPGERMIREGGQPWTGTIAYPWYTLGLVQDNMPLAAHAGAPAPVELERELQRLTEELEREGRAHNHRERQRLGEELERERLARLGDQRNVQRLERDLQVLQQLLEERQQALKASKKGLWTNLLRSNNH